MKPKVNFWGMFLMKLLSSKTWPKVDESLHVRVFSPGNSLIWAGKMRKRENVDDIDATDQND
jgi:hypothetical protein